MLAAGLVARVLWLAQPLAAVCLVQKGVFGPIPKNFGISWGGLVIVTNFV